MTGEASWGTNPCWLARSVTREPAGSVGSQPVPPSQPAAGRQSPRGKGREWKELSGGGWGTNPGRFTYETPITAPRSPRGDDAWIPTSTAATATQASGNEDKTLTLSAEGEAGYYRQRLGRLPVVAAPRMRSTPRRAPELEDDG